MYATMKSGRSGLEKASARTSSKAAFKKRRKEPYMKQNPELSKQSYLRLTCRSGLRDKAEENWGREKFLLQLWFHVLPTQAADDAKETAGGLARMLTETSSCAGENTPFASAISTSGTMSGFAAIVVFSSPPSALL